MPWIIGWLRILARLLASPRGPADLVLENLALRQQLGVLRRTVKPRLRNRDRVFWALLSRVWPRWKEACALVKPETVVAWHRAGFQVFHGELLKLGFRVSERTVQRYLPKRPSPPGAGQSWKAFLANHREHIAVDFFQVPTLDFRVLTGLVILCHGRREIVHLNVTANPTAAWVRQQLREAFPFDEAPRYLIFDRDTILIRPFLGLTLWARRWRVALGSCLGLGAVKVFAESLAIKPVITSFRSPWQNGVAERWIGSLRRDLLDHVIVRNEAHLLRLLKAYQAYYHTDRTHLGLGKDSPMGRLVEPRAGPESKVVASPGSGARTTATAGIRQPESPSRAPRRRNMRLGSALPWGPQVIAIRFSKAPVPPQQVGMKVRCESRTLLFSRSRGLSDGLGRPRMELCGATGVVTWVEDVSPVRAAANAVA